jgi:hypothetical protein
MEKGDTMKYQDCKRRNCNDRWMSMAIAGAAMLAAAACGGCLYTAIPAMAGSTSSYHAPTDNQPSQPPQTSNDQTNQNKQQNTAPQGGPPQNAAPPQGQGGTTP